MEKRRYPFQPIVGNLWIEALSDDELILNELKRLKLSTYLRKSKYDLSLWGYNRRLVLRHLTGQAFLVWNRKILSPRKYGIECSLFINNSQVDSIDLLQEAMVLARLCWIEYPLYMPINPKLQTKNIEQILKRCGWKPYGVNKAGFLIYISDFGT